MAASGLEPRDEDDDEPSVGVRVDPAKLAAFDELMARGGIAAIVEAVQRQAGDVIG